MNVRTSPRNAFLASAAFLFAALAAHGEAARRVGHDALPLSGSTMRGCTGLTPAAVSAKLSEQFLSTSPDAYRPAGCRGKAYGGNEYVHYSVVSLWVNALECARLRGDTNLVNRLVAAFEPAHGDKKRWMNDCRHVDLSIVGAVPLEIAILTGDARAKELGLVYADRQWEEPREGLNWGERWYDPIPLAERHANWEKGFSPETRMWIDDMYMITLLQSQAYRLTGDRKYIDRAAKEMCLYLGKLQRGDGLFNHAPGAPFAWGRGNGWMAAAMAMNLKFLPAGSEWRGPILAGFRRMTAALLRWQRPGGLWGQLVDDAESYDETSATAMFAYAFAEGAKTGVLGDEYMAAAKRAYAALVSRIDEHGNLADVCVGTGWRNDRNHYLTRPRANGDPHGQAPLLWLCRALTEGCGEGAAASVAYQLSANLPLRHDGYVVERRATGNGERIPRAKRVAEGDALAGVGTVKFVVKAATERAFLYADYESNRWMNAERYPFVRDPRFRFRALNVSRSAEPLREWIAATGANAVYLKRGRPDARLLAECAELGIPAYGFLYGCDAAKWNRERYDCFVAAHPSARGVTPPRSWEKGTMCPSSPATREFFAEAVREIVVPGLAGVVVCLWDDYGLNCVCDRCRANGFAGNWGRQVAFAVKAWEGALKPLGKELIVRTWASGASHWLGDEWVHAPGYGGETGEPLSVWGEAMKAAGGGVRFQTKVYNADCQPDPPFSALLPVAPRRDIAEWQITGQTVGLQYLPASVVGQTARQFRRVAELVSPEGGVMLYAGAYKRDGYAALSDDLNSVNIHVWRQLSWNPDDDVESLWREWAEARFGANATAVIAAMKATERATTAAFSPLGLGAPTESFFAGSVARRESLLRYTNRYFLPEGRAALAPTLENIARVISEKDAAIRALDRECSQMANGAIVRKPGIRTRFSWLRAHLEATRALDGALWRYFYLRRRGGQADVRTAETLAEIGADLETIRRLSKDGSLCAGLGSPVSLMKDIFAKSVEVSGRADAARGVNMSREPRIAECR